MCGIAGLIRRDPAQPADERLVRRMCDAIRHRGPDDEGIWTDGPASIGMRRLSIIDLAGGHQPIFNETGEIGIVFNGEIYNYRSLRDWLLGRGHTLRTHSDTEVIVHLYEEMGARCVERLRGMFAFAIWDSTTRTALLARDRFGIKPLYIATHPDRIAFASELKALVQAGQTARTLDHGAIDAYLQLSYMPAPRTPFTDVQKLEPGCTWMMQDGGTPVIRRYWDLPTERRAAPADVEARVREWLDDSVRAHLESDVPVAAFLSGGIDSSAIVSSMALAGQRPHAFTARYVGSGAQASDETPLARLLADRYGAQLSVIDIEPDISAHFEGIVYALDEPLADESALPTWLISRAVAAQYKVALAGTGGDELFAGYRRHRALALTGAWAAMPLALRRALAAGMDRVREPADGSLTLHRIKRFLRAGAGDVASRYLDLQTRLQDAERAALWRTGAGGTANVALDAFRQAYASGGQPEGVNSALLMDYRHYLPDDLLALSDRIASAHSLEVRVPFVDHEFVEQVYPLPDQLKLGLGAQKKLLRRALVDRLPAEHFRAPKRGFVGPTAMWLRHELREPMRDELSPERLARLGLFDGAVVQRWMDEHQSQRHNREGILWALLSFSVWHRQFVERTPS